jgi:hypothetical protein
VITAAILFVPLFFSMGKKIAASRIFELFFVLFGVLLIAD